MKHIPIFCWILLRAIDATVNDTQWIPGMLVKCKTLKRQKNESFIYLNERVETMNNSFAKIMKNPVNARGQIKIEWIGEKNVRIAVKPKYLKMVSKFVVHDLRNPLTPGKNSFLATCLWKQLAADPMNHVMLWPTHYIKHLSILGSQEKNINVVYRNVESLQYLPTLLLFHPSDGCFNDPDWKNQTQVTREIYDFFALVHPAIFKEAMSKMNHSRLLQTISSMFALYQKHHLKEDVYGIMDEEDQLIDIQRCAVSQGHTQDICKAVSRWMTTTVSGASLQRFWFDLLSYVREIVHSKIRETARTELEEDPPQWIPGRIAFAEALDYWFRMNAKPSKRPTPNVHLVIMSPFSTFSVEDLTDVFEKVDFQSWDLRREILKLLSWKTHESSDIGWKQRRLPYIDLALDTCNWIKKQLLEIKIIADDSSSNSPHPETVPFVILQDVDFCFVEELLSNPRNILLFWPRPIDQLSTMIMDQHNIIFKNSMQRFMESNVVLPFKTEIIHNATELAFALCALFVRVNIEMASDMLKRLENAQRGNAECRFFKASLIKSVWLRVRVFLAQKAMDAANWSEEQMIKCTYCPEAETMIILMLNLKNLRESNQRRHNQEFWTVFVQCYSASLQSLARRNAGDLLDLMRRLDLLNDPVDVIEALLVHRAIEQYLDPSFSVYVITESEYVKNETGFSKHKIMDVARKLEYESVVDRIQWILK